MSDREDYPCAQPDPSTTVDGICTICGGSVPEPEPEEESEEES